MNEHEPIYEVPLSRLNELTEASHELVALRMLLRELWANGSVRAALGKGDPDGLYERIEAAHERIEAALQAGHQRGHIANLARLLDHFDRYASIEDGPPYLGSPFEAEVKMAVKTAFSSLKRFN